MEMMIKDSKVDRDTEKAERIEIDKFKTSDAVAKVF
jgi:hypothetical protein